MKIKLTSVYVDDQEKALRFYTEVLGFVKKADVSQGPYRWLTVASPEEPEGTELQLALNDNPAARAYQQAMFQQDQPAAMFFTDDMQADYERMKARGAEFTMPPTDVTGSKIAKLNDTLGLPAMPSRNVVMPVISPSNTTRASPPASRRTPASRSGRKPTRWPMIRAPRSRGSTLAQRSRMRSAVPGSGSRLQLSTSATPPRTTWPACGRIATNSGPIAPSTKNSSRPGFSTITCCPRTGRTPGSPARSLAATPEQFTTTGAAAAASASEATGRASSNPPAATNRAAR